MWFLPQTFRQLELLEVLALNANNFEMMPRVLCDMDRLVDVRDMPPPAARTIRFIGRRMTDTDALCLDD